MDLGLLLLRALMAIVLFAHGTQKALGWFNGPGPAGAAAMFEKLGHRPARAKVRLAALCEISSALLLLFGLLTPLGAAIATGTMLVAGVSMIALHGTFWNSGGGGEYPLVLAAMAACLGFTGPGQYCIDALITALPWNGDGAARAVTGIAVLVVGTASAVVPVADLRRVRTHASNPA